MVGAGARRLAFAAIVWALGVASAKGEELILFGGGNLAPEACKTFVQSSGGSKARLLIIAWATEKPFEAYLSLLERFRPYQPFGMVLAQDPAHPEFEEDRLYELLEWASGVFFTGGDQVRILDRLEKFPRIRRLLESRHKEGLVIAGTSAGTAIMGDRAITGEGDFTVIDPKAVVTLPGLGLVHDVLFDQHFIKRQRQNRILSLLRQNREKIAVGIDEDVAVRIVDGRSLTVISPGYVSVFSASDSQKTILMDLVSGEDKVDLVSRVITYSPSPPTPTELAMP